MSSITPIQGTDLISASRTVINSNFTNLNIDKLETVTEANLTLADNTTANVSTTKHGLTPKLPNDATKFLDGTGAYAVPSGLGGGDFSSNTATSVDSELVLFSGTGGKTGKRSSGSGRPKLTSGVLSLSPVDVSAEITGNLPVANLNSGTGASAASFWRGDGAWAVPTNLDYQSFTANGTWTKPTGTSSSSLTLIQIWGGGASGGASTSSAGNSSGGGGGAYLEIIIPTSLLSATETVVVGATVAGDSNDGLAGNQSSFKTYITYGGGEGVSGSGTALGAGGGGGGGLLTAGSGGSVPGGAGYGGNGGRPLGGVGVSEAAGPDNSGSGGASGGGSGGAAGGFSVYGGGGGGGAGTSTGSNTGGVGGYSVYGGGGGGGGGRNGNGGGAAGVSTFGGNGGAGGGTGVAGSAGVAPGGGGGAAGQNAGPTLNGGDGARGEVRVHTLI